MEIAISISKTVIEYKPVWGEARVYSNLELSGVISVECWVKKGEV